MRKTGLFAGSLSILWLAGCGAGGAATGAQARGTAASTRSVRHSARDPRQRGDSAAPMHGTPDELNRRYRDAKALELQWGTASYYADSLTGHRMANGQLYDPSRPTMAHRTLPFGTIVRVIRVSTGAAVTVCVTDRGPFGQRRRVADLSREAARRLDMIRDGVVDVRLEVLSQDRAGLRTPCCWD